MNWEVIKNETIRDQTLRNTLHHTGFGIAGQLLPEVLLELQALKQRLHSNSQQQGGTFYSLYSDDIEYRKTAHQAIQAILETTYQQLFVHYKAVIHSFIIKTPGPGSEFSLHQDSTGLDEFAYSPLSVWIPLQDTNLQNGGLCVVPKSHHFFYPYRGISFQSPFHDWEDVLRTYLLPIELKAGEILLFDNRLVHYSHQNTSDQARCVVMSGIFPKEAPLISVYKNEVADADAPIEIYQQEDDFLLVNKAFYKNCTERPYLGKKIKELNIHLPVKTHYDFMSWASKNGVSQPFIPALLENNRNMNIVSEPVEL